MPRKISPGSKKAKDSQDARELQKSIIRFCKEHGADLVGFTPVERWDEANEVPPDFRPKAIFPMAKTVIVMGIQMPLPVVETTPSILHTELYRTVNIELDALAVDLVRYLNRLGYPSTFFTRDGYSSLEALEEKPMAAFGHVMAAKYAGLGTIGISHCLLTPEYGPRVRLISVFTAAVLPPTTMMKKSLCIRCGLCAETCPKQAITMNEGSAIGEYNKSACLERAKELTEKRCYPCGNCIKVCPIGKDRLLYRQPGVAKKYREEATSLAANPDDPRYRSWQHIRKYGVRSNQPAAKSNTDSTRSK